VVPLKSTLPLKALRATFQLAQEDITRLEAQPNAPIDDPLHSATGVINAVSVQLFVTQTQKPVFAQDRGVYWMGGVYGPADDYDSERCARDGTNDYYCSLQYFVGAGAGTKLELHLTRSDSLSPVAFPHLIFNVNLDVHQQDPSRPCLGQIEGQTYCSSNGLMACQGGKPVGKEYCECGDTGFAASCNAPPTPVGPNCGLCPGGE
jgi:hypothetical protein